MRAAFDVRDAATLDEICALADLRRANAESCSRVVAADALSVRDAASRVG